MNKLNERGAVDFMFVAVLVVLVAAAAFTMWRIQAADETVSDTAANTANESTIERPNSNSNDQESGGGEAEIVGTRVESGQGAFSIVVPAGFEMTKVLSSDWLRADSAENTVYDENGEATISEVPDYGSDNPTRLTVIAGERSGFAALSSEATVQGEITTNSGVVGTKYFEKEPVEQKQGLGAISGQETTTYEFIDGDMVTYVFYNRQRANEYNGYVDVDDPDIADLVEEMVKTLQVN